MSTFPYSIPSIPCSAASQKSSRASIAGRSMYVLILCGSVGPIAQSVDNKPQPTGKPTSHLRQQSSAHRRIRILQVGWRRSESVVAAYTTSTNAGRCGSPPRSRATSAAAAPLAWAFGSQAWAGRRPLRGPPSSPVRDKRVQHSESAKQVFTIDQ